MSTSQHRFDEYEFLATALQGVISHLIKDFQPPCDIYHWPTSPAYLADQRNQKNGAKRPFCGVRVITREPQQVDAVCEVLTKAFTTQLADPAFIYAQDPAGLGPSDFDKDYRYASNTVKLAAGIVDVHKDLFDDDARKKIQGLGTIPADLQVCDAQDRTDPITDLHPSDCQPSCASFPPGGNIPGTVSPVQGDGRGLG